MTAIPRSASRRTSESNTSTSLSGNELVIAVCDRAYEDLDSRPLHWSVPDPAPTASIEAFEGAYDDITGRIDRLAASFEADA